MPQIKPVRKRRVPQYPTMEQVRHDPVILKRPPMRWQNKPALCATLMFVLSSGMFAACERSSDKQPELKESTILDRINVPVFEYGDGIGAFGCVSVTAPLFLTEDEAGAIIRDEAVKFGVEFSVGGERSVILPDAKDGTDISLDGFSPELGLAYEFVSADDFDEWRTKQPMTTVKSYNTKEAAIKLADKNENIAVFYDPIGSVENLYEEYRRVEREYLISQGIDPESDYSAKLSDAQWQQLKKLWTSVYDELEAAARASTEEDLRAQVRSFIEWLAVQGII